MTDILRPLPTVDERLLGHIEPAFEVLDTPRTYDRVIMDSFGFVEPLDHQADTGQSLPLRVVHEPVSGWQIELGPFNLDATDIWALRSAIAAYDQAVGR